MRPRPMFRRDRGYIGPRISRMPSLAEIAVIAEDIRLVQSKSLSQLSAWATVHRTVQRTYSMGIKIDANDPVLSAYRPIRWLSIGARRHVCLSSIRTQLGAITRGRRAV